MIPRDSLFTITCARDVGKYLSTLKIILRSLNISINLYVEYESFDLITAFLSECIFRINNYYTK